MAGPNSFGLDCTISRLTAGATRPFYFKAITYLVFPLLLMCVAAVMVPLVG